MDTVVNDIPLRIYIPQNATMSLHVGLVDKSDTTVIYTAEAAGIRADNGKIVNTFVLNGELLSAGSSKKGFCASIDGVVTIGVADNTPLLTSAIEKEGCFFRQYPLVDDGKIVENKPKGKSIRRGLCNRHDEIFMVETTTPESLHDFAQALADLDVRQAIYLNGSTSYGWAIDSNGKRHEFGKDDYYSGRIKTPKNISYIVWRKRV